MNKSAKQTQRNPDSHRSSVSPAPNAARCSRSNNLGLAKTLPLLLVAIIACTAGVLLALQNTSDEEPLDSIQANLGNSIVLPADFKQLPEFALLNKNAEPIDGDYLKGQWHLMFFGFTHCPDDCPLTLSTVSEALEQIHQLDNEIPQPGVVFVSVDPKRDTPEGLKNYVEYFNSEFKALTGTLNQMYDLINPLNVVVSYTADEENKDEYTVDHTASILLIDPELRMRGKFSAPHKASEIAADYQTILKHLM